MKPKSTRFALLAVSTLAITFAHATDYDFSGASGGDWATTTNWTPNGNPGSGDTITINKDLIGVSTGTVTTLAVNYSASGIVTRQISGISVTDSTPNPATEVIYSFAPGVAGSQLEFNTTSPSISTNFVNTNSMAQRLVIANPLFSQPGTTLTLGGIGNSALEFNVAAGNTAFNTNVTGMTCASTGIVVLYNKISTAISLPAFDFSTNNNKLVLSSGPFSITGKTVGNGTGGLTVGGNASLTLGTGTSFTLGNLVTSSNNSADFYVNGAATVNVNGASGSFTNLNIGQNMSGTATSAFNVIAGDVTVSGTATVGAPNNTVTANAIETLNLNVSGGSLTFTGGAAFDVNIARNDRSNTGTATPLTVKGTLTVSGGVLDMGTFGRLVLARDYTTGTAVGNSANDNTQGIINLNSGGTLKTARGVIRGGYSAGQSGTDFAKFFFNGGTYQANATSLDLITGFGVAGTTDGVFVSNGGAVIDTEIPSGNNANLSANLLEDPASTGGGLTKQGVGRLYVTGTNTFTGGIDIQAGTLGFSKTAAFGSGTATIKEAADAALRLNGSAIISRPITTYGNNANIFNADASYSVTVQGGITEDPGYTPNIAGTDVYGFESVGSTFVTTAPVTLPGMQVNKGQIGTLELDVAGNTYGRMWIYTGNVKAGIAGVLDPTAQVDLRTTASVLDLNGFNQTVASLVGSAASGLGSSITSASAAVLTISPPSGSSTYAGTISGALGITKTGAGTQILSGPNTYTGETVISAGILSLSTDDTLSDTAAVRIAASGATLDLTFTGDDVVDSFYIGGVQQAAGMWGAVGSGAAHESALITGTGLLNVTNGTAGGSYTTWASLNGVTGGPNGDSDNDGISNLVEYALNLNPAGSDGSAGTFSGNTLTFHKRPEAVTNGDVTYVIEESTDLGVSDPWHAVTPTTNTPTEISILLTPGSPAKNFARFEAVVTP